MSWLAPLAILGRGRAAALGRARIEHWSDPNSYDPAWDWRVAHVVRLIRPDETWVCDLGCGRQSIRASLPGDRVYLPADLRQWTPDTALCDLDGGKLPVAYLSASDVCLMIGVLGYMADPEWLLLRLGRRVDRLIFTYRPSEMNPRPGRYKRNHLSEREIGRMLAHAGFAARGRHLLDRQILFEAEAERAPPWRAARKRAARAVIQRRLTRDRSAGV